MATEGGRFDFEDGGAYVGCWSEGRAHGPGLVTGPRGQGEFSGSWEDGFEASGVYIWPRGNTYKGEWRQGKRHGLGVEAKGRWVYRGEWMTGFKGRYGVRQSDSSGARYEGTWQLGMQDGAGVETYADGGTYAGCWFHGTRHGLGVRQSVPFGLAAPYRDETAEVPVAERTPRRQRQDSLTSLRSAHPPDEATTSPAAAEADTRRECRSGRRRRLPGDEFRAGFVLSSRHWDIADASAAGEDGSQNSPAYLPRRLRPTNIGSGGAGGGTSLGRALLGRLRKQRSAGDIEQQQQKKKRQQQQESPSPSPSPQQQQQQQSDKQKQLRHRFLGHRSSSVRSAVSEQASPASAASTLAVSELDEADDAEELEEQLDPSVTEVYCGEWKQDRRCGLGVAERSDGLKYEGEWDGNRRHGYGATTFPDGSCEAGKYRCNLLSVSTARRGRLFLLKSSRLRDRVDTAVREARVAMAEAIKRAENAQARQQVSRQKADLADAAAEKACIDSETARKVARQYAPDFHQPGPDFMKRRTETDVLSSLSLTTARPRLSRASRPASSSAATAGAAVTSRSLIRQRHIEESSPARNNGAATASGLQVTESFLQVGGSRRGSFRLSPAAARSSSNEAVQVLAAQSAASGSAAAAGEAATSASSASVPRHHRDRVKPLSRVLDTVPAIDHFDQYRVAPGLYRKKRDSGLGRDSSLEDSPSNSGFMAADRPHLAGAAGLKAAASNGPASHANFRGDSDSGLSELSGGGSLNRCRWRTMPSLIGSSSMRTSASAGPNELLDDTALGDRQLPSDPEQAASIGTSYIIENGVRKRVLHHRLNCLNSFSATARSAISSPHRYQQSNSLTHRQQSLQQQHRQQQQLCRIESQARLCKDLGEGSLPDVSVCRYIMRSGLMSREEAAQLGRRRRLELLRMEEQQQRQQRLRQRSSGTGATAGDARECKRLPVEDPMHSFVSRAGLRRRLLCSRCASLEPSSNNDKSRTASEHWRRLLLLSLEEPQAATNRGVSGVGLGGGADGGGGGGLGASTAAGSQSALTAAVRLFGAAVAHALWRLVRWLRLNAGELIREHFLLLFVLMVNTSLAILVFHLLTSNAKLP